MVNEVVLRTQAQAVYAPENIGHFGLNLRRYAHFTSPIRRYADLIVHRAPHHRVRTSATTGSRPRTRAQLDDTAELVSGAERRAMAAERETIDRLVAEPSRRRRSARVFTGRIGGVVGAGLFVTLNDTGADGFVPVSTLGSDYFVFDETRHALVGRPERREHSSSAIRVEVKLVEATPISGGLRFEIVSDGRKGKPPVRGEVRKSVKRKGRRG